MRVRGLLIVTAIVSAILGAVVAYLVLTVPNDLEAGALLRQARTEIGRKNYDGARKALERIVQQFPRTDAAAAATVALIQLENEERSLLQHRIDALQRDRDQLSSSLARLDAAVTKIENTPPPAPVVVQPAPQPAARVFLKPVPRHVQKKPRKRR